MAVKNQVARTPKKLFPMGTKVVVVPAKPKEKTDGGILLPEDAQRLPKSGKVFAVGADVTKVKVGDNVLFAQYVGHQLELNDGVNLPLEVIVMEEANIDAKIE
jgi:chaperonin GroES